MTVQPEDLAMTLDMSWKLEAACKGSELSVFFGSDQKKAKRICGSCLVRKDCLEYALLTEQSGFWGGLSAAERRKAYPDIIRNSMREDFN